MKKFYINIFILLLGVIIGYFFSTKILDPCPQTLSIKSDTTYNIIEKDSTIYNLSWQNISIPKVVYDSIYDSIQIPVFIKKDIRNFYTKYYYSDTVFTSSYGEITVNDTIWKNKIFSRNVKTTLEIPEVTKTVYKKSKGFYLGGNIQGNSNSINFIGIKGLYNNSNNMYGIGVGVNQKFKPILSLSVYWKLKFN
jgi:hypothetical protein